MSDGYEELFVVQHEHSSGDAVLPVVCQTCGHTYFTSKENYNMAMRRGMQIACIVCASIMAADEGIVVAGKIKHGKVIDYIAGGHA